MILFKDDVLYTSSNEWAKKFNDIVRIGIDEIADAHS